MYTESSDVIYVSPEARGFENLPIQELNIAWDFVLSEHPELSALELEKVLPSQEDFLQYTAGEFVIEGGTEKPLVRVVLGDIKHLDSLRDTRSVAVKILADKLGVDVHHMDGKVLSVLIFLHEIGHARDYLRNYRNNSDYESTQDAVAAWHEHYQSELDSLPVPSMDPSDLRACIQDSGGFQPFMERYPELTRMNNHNISSESRLLELQEIAYRSLPHESYADDFANKILRKYWEKIGFDQSLLKEIADSQATS